MTSERRSNPRLRSLLGGRICFNQRRSTLDCVVRNISDNGALLMVSDAVAVPLTFDLDISQRQRSYNAMVRWRDGTRMGISFDAQSAGSAEVVPLDLARRLKHCEEEKLRLKNRILQLTEAG